MCRSAAAAACVGARPLALGVCSLAEGGVPGGSQEEGERSRMDAHLEEMARTGPCTESWGGVSVQEGGGPGSEAVDATAGEGSP